MSSPPRKSSKRVSKENESIRSIDSILENLEDGKIRSRDGATSPEHIYDMKQHWVQVLEQIKKRTPDMNQEEVQVSVENCTDVLHRAGYVSFLFSNIVFSRDSDPPTHTKQSTRRRRQTVEIQKEKENSEAKSFITFTSF